MKIKRVRQNNYGIYVWELPNGKILASTDGDILLVQAKYGSLQAQAELAKAAAYWGYPDGKAKWEDAHPCTQEEWEEQMEELTQGIMIPEAR